VIYDINNIYQFGKKRQPYSPERGPIWAAAGK
jgi:hypothetical protein